MDYSLLNELSGRELARHTNDPGIAMDYMTALALKLSDDPFQLLKIRICISRSTARGPVATAVLVGMLR